MTYSVGGLIEATDYNGFVSTTAGANLNATWGTASSTGGYGQGNVATVSAGGTVTATQWATLVNNISTAANHQGTGITSRTAPSTGNTITILANVNTDLTNLYTNRNNAAGSGTTIGTFTGTTSKTSATGSGSTAWTITFTHTVTFANSAATFSFFNAGGLVKIMFKKTADATESDTEWNDLATTLTGAIFISGAAASKTINGVAYTGTTKIGGTGTPTVLTTGTGFYGLLTTNTTIYQQYADTAPYTGQYIRVQARVDSTSAPTVLTLTTDWVDPGGSGAGSSDNISGGTATTSPATSITGTAPTTLVNVIPPSSTYLSNTWGTPTIAASVV